MNNNEYVQKSLELHLFFDRIMKEHSFFLSAAFLEKDNNLKEIANRFGQKFSNILTKVIHIAEGNVSNSFIKSGEMVTENTLKAEMKTSELTGVVFDYDITKKEINLSSGNKFLDNLVDNIREINKETIPLVEDLIKFKKDVLNNVLSCHLYTANYPLLISHIMNEAKMYLTLLKKLESRVGLMPEELYKQEIFWNNIMRDHAEFIRGLLDPSEKDLIKLSDKYVDEYNAIISSYNNLTNLNNASLKETINFRNFKVTGEEGILNCKIKSIIIPLLADHVVREANHFIRILESLNTKTSL